RRIQDAESGRHGDGLQARGIRSARSLELPCLGAGAGGGRVKNIDLLRSMLLQRRFEERVAEAYALGRIGGFCHLYIGQEAVSTGAFHEALNMAGLWKLPVIYIIENNRYGMGTALERASAIHDIYERGAAYNMPRSQCDGQDVFAMRKAVQEAVDRARKESVPTLLEARTYRFMGHSMSDAVSGTYRTKAELEEWQQRDPIVLLR